MMKFKFWELIKSDLARITTPTVANLVKTYINPHSVCFRYLVNLRILQAAKRSNLFCRLFIGIPSHIAFLIREIRYDINIPTNVSIGQGMHIVHRGGIFLNVRSIGDNFTVFQNVTCGKRYANDMVPIIGNDVTICTGAVICGGVVLEDGCTVGANSYVDKNVLKQTVVAGLPAKVIKKK